MKREGASTLFIHGFPWALSYLFRSLAFAFSIVWNGALCMVLKDVLKRGHHCGNLCNDSRWNVYYTCWGIFLHSAGEYQDPSSADGRLTLLGESIVDSFIVASLSWGRATTTILLCGEWKYFGHILQMNLPCSWWTKQLYSSDNFYCPCFLYYP